MKFSWTEWREKQAQMVASRFDRKFTMLFIDQDFSKEAGDVRGGIKILRDLQDTIPATEATELRCALLTNTKNPGEEHGAWDAFATEEKLDRSRFMLISKERLLDEQFGGFILMARLAILNPLCEILREQAAGVYEQALAGAKKQLDGVTIYDVEKIVFASSRKEGVWELDTLFRILGLFLRREARSLAAANNPLREMADSVRSLAGPSAFDPKQEQTKATEIRRMELYEDGDYLNKHHTPIDLGDVFEVVKNAGKKDESKKRFMLVAQPCEMMVRVEAPLDGKRRPTTIEAVLIEIISAEPKGKSYRLDYFEPSGAHAYVVFGKARVANLNILDLCVFRKDGRAELSVADTPAAELIPSWRLRHIVLMKNLIKCVDCVGRLLSTLKPLDPKEKDQRQKQNMNAATKAIERWSIDQEFGPNPLFPPILFCEKNGARIKFLCQRIRRLNQPWSGALLTEYTQNWSRAAFEHDFGNVDSED